MTVSCTDHVNVLTDKHTEVISKRGAIGLMIFRWEASPAGIDWEMIRSMKRSARGRKTRAEHS